MNSKAVVLILSSCLRLVLSANVVACIRMSL